VEKHWVSDSSSFCIQIRRSLVLVAPSRKLLGLDDNTDTWKQNTSSPAELKNESKRDLVNVV
jgi:hypothetical protein